MKYSYLDKVSNDNKPSNHVIEIVAKETAVLRQWEIDKQELGLSKEVVDNLKFCHLRKFERHELTFGALAPHPSEWRNCELW